MSEQKVEIIKCESEEIETILPDGTKRVDVIIYAPSVSISSAASDKKEGTSNG